MEHVVDYFSFSATRVIAAAFLLGTLFGAGGAFAIWLIM